MKVHESFDSLWKNNGLTRQKAYQKLSMGLGIKKQDCHIGMFDVQTCKKAIETIKNFLTPP